MDSLFVLTATRDFPRSGSLTIGYPSKELALSAAAIIRHLWATVMVTAPDGSLLMQLESAETLLAREPGADSAPNSGKS
jgi:hypothetical protein